MTPETLQRLGKVAILWNQSDAKLTEILWLYMGTDTPTAALITKPMRSSDCEKLLKSLAKAKEVRQEVIDEIDAGVNLFRRARENRNELLHNLGPNSPDLSLAGINRIEACAQEMESVHAYLTDLKVAISALITRREEPIIYDEEGVENDPVHPDHIFEAPDRPEQPDRISIENLLEQADD